MRLYQRGFALLPVVFTVTVIALLAYTMNQKAAYNLRQVSSQIETATVDNIVQTALSKGRWLAMNNNCLMPSNLIDQSFGKDRYSVTYTGDYNALQIAVDVTTAGGIHTQHVDVVNKIYDYNNQRLVNFESDNDGFIEGQSGHEYHDKGSDTKLKVGTQNNKEYRSLLYFNLSGIPESAKIRNADLRLYQSSNGNEQTLDVFRVKKNWSQGELTWVNRTAYDDWSSRGGDFFPKVESTMLVGSDGGWKAANVSEVVSRWVQKRDVNYGFLLKGHESNSPAKTFHSNNYTTDVLLKPQLAVSFCCPCGVQCTMGQRLEALMLTTLHNNNQLGEVDFSNEDLIFYEPGKGGVVTKRVVGTDLGANKAISALHWLANGKYLLSFSQSGILAGVAFTPMDVLEFDADRNTAVKRFDGSAQGLTSEISALYVDSADNLVFAVASWAPVSWKGLSFTNTDLVRFNLNDDTAQLLFDASTFDIYAPIKSFHRLDNGSYVFSYEHSTAVKGMDFGLGDLAQYNPANDQISKYFAGENLKHGSHISALHIGKASGKLPAKPMAFWKMNDGSGTVAVDSLGAHDGTLQGAAWSAEGINGVVYFDGVDDGISVPHDASLVFSDGMTATAFIKFDVIDGIQTIVSKKATAGYQYKLVVDNGVVNFTFGSNTITSPDALVVNRWYHIGATADVENERIALYIDGVSVRNEILSGSAAVMNVNADVFIGQDTNSDFLNGYIDDVRLFNTPLITADIASQRQVSATPTSGDYSPIEVHLCEGSYIDDFSSAVGNGSIGTMDWSNDFWIEVGESDGFANRDVRINAGYLRVRDNDNGGEGAKRLVPLAGAISATLNIKYRRRGLDRTSDYVAVQVSSTGINGPFTDVGRIKGQATDNITRTKQWDISSYASSNTAIRLISSPSLGSMDEVRFYELSVICDSTGVP